METKGSTTHHAPRMATATSLPLVPPHINVLISPAEIGVTRTELHDPSKTHASATIVGVFAAHLEDLRPHNASGDGLELKTSEYGFDVEEDKKDEERDHEFHKSPSRGNYEVVPPGSIRLCIHATEIGPFTRALRYHHPVSTAVPSSQPNPHRTLRSPLPRHNSLWRKRKVPRISNG
jgi:hypothetical protein